MEHLSYKGYMIDADAVRCQDANGTWYWYPVSFITDEHGKRLQILVGSQPIKQEER